MTSSPISTGALPTSTAVKSIGTRPAMGSRLPRISTDPRPLAAIYGLGTSLILLSAAGLFALALLALLLVAVLATVSDVLTQSMMQLSVPNRFRGRAMGSWVLAVGASPLGHLQMGALAVTLGVGGALLVNGGALIGVAILATVAAPRLRRL